MWDPVAPKLIQEVIPNAKIIVILRELIERVHSHYLLRLSGGKTYSFSKAIKKALKPDSDYYTGIIVRGGWYNKQVTNYLKIFGLNQVKILIFEEFIKDAKKP